MNSPRHPNVLLHLGDAFDSVAQRHTRREVERERHGRKLALMIHRDGRGGRLIFRDGAQRNDRADRAIGCAQVDLVQSFGALPEFWIDLHNDMVLVQRAEHGRDLPLSESIVKCVVDQLRRNAETRGSGTVVDERGLKPIILLIAVHVGEAGQFAHLLQQDRPPLNEIVQIVALNCILVLRTALPSANAQVLSSLHEDRCSWDRSQFRTKTVDELAGADFALLQRLQRQVKKSAIGRAVATHKCSDTRHRRIVFDQVHETRRSSLHRGKGSVFRPSNSPENSAVILLRKESLRHDDKQENIQADRDQQYHERDERMPQDHSQAALVMTQHPRKYPFRSAVEPAVLLQSFVSQQPRAHHRSRRQRNDERYEDRRRERHGKLAK